MTGGVHQMGIRPGTEPIELAVGLHHALRCWQRDAQTRAARMASLRDRFEELLRGAELGIVINGLGAPRLPHTTNIAFPGLDCQAVHMALDMAGVAFSSAQRAPVVQVSRRRCFWRCVCRLRSWRAR